MTEKKKRSKNQHHLWQQKEGRGIWYVRFRFKGTNYKISTKTPMLTEAAAMAPDIIAAIKRGEHDKKELPDIVTFEMACEKYLEFIHQETTDTVNPKQQLDEQIKQLQIHAKSVKRDYVTGTELNAIKKILIPILIQSYRSTDISMITEFHIKQFFKAYQKAGASGSTCNRKRAILHKVFRLANASNAPLGFRIHNNPMTDIEPFENNTSRYVTLTQDELNRLYDECRKSKNKYLYPVVLLLAETGARKDSELLPLVWGSVKWDSSIIELPTSKTNKKRVIYVPDSSLIILKQLYDAHKTPPRPLDRVFPFVATDLRQSWNTALDAAGLPRSVWMRDLRHVFATNVANLPEAKIEQISQLLGHATVEMTKRYINNSDSDLLALVNKQKKRSN